MIFTKSFRNLNNILFSQEHDFYQTIQESQQVERVYKGMFDFTIVNDEFDETYRTLRRELDNLSAEQQWVPINWVY